MFIHLILLLTGITIPTPVHGSHNVSVDDQDPAIVYAPAASWARSANNILNVGGAHMLTQDPAATATFSFTGTAVYFMSPLWPYLVNTAVTLDSAPPVLIDLVDHGRPNAGQGSETVQSQIVWGAAGLSNVQHKLVVSVGAGQPFAVVDTLIYTVLDPEDTATTTMAPATTSSTRTSTSSSMSSAASTAPNIDISGTSKHVLPIALGVVFGCLALLIVAVGIWFCLRRRKRPVSEAWTVAGHPYPSSSEMAAVPVNGPNGMPAHSNTGTYHPYHPYLSDGAGAPQYTYGAGYPGISPQDAGAAQGVGAMPTHPYAQATGQGSYPGFNPYSSPGAFQQQRAPNRYQPNTLSTITETSTPPIGGGTPLANSPSSNHTDIYHEGSPERASSIPSEISSLQYQSYGEGNRDALPKRRDFNIASNRVLPAHPPAYTR